MIPSLPGLLQAISLFVVAILLARPLGGYMEAAMEGKRVFLSPIIRPVERSVYWILRVDEKVEQNWRAYAVSVIVFSFVCILALYLQQRLQAYLPLNQGGVPGIGGVSPDLAYFAILPAMFTVAYPELNSLNVMGLSNPQSAILSAVIFNALIIIALVPLSLRGVAYRAAPAAELLRRNLLIYGVGGVFAPFVGIKAIDLIITAVHLA